MLSDRFEFDETKPSFGQWPVAQGCQKAVVMAVRAMEKVSKMLQKQRNELGALQLKSAELSWKVTNDLKVSISAPEEADDAHHLIEEFMVAANCLVAMRLVKTFPGV